MLTSDTVLESNKIYNMNCLEGLKLIPDNTVSLVLKYGTVGIKQSMVIGKRYKLTR